MRLFLCIMAILSGTIVALATDGSTEGDLRKLQAIVATGLQANGKQQLADAQIAWERFRDAECRYRQANFPLMTTYSECRQSFNQNRAKELTRQREWLNGIAGNTNDATKSCRTTIGDKRASRMVRHCLAVSSATRPPCNAQNSCDLIAREIRKSCTNLGADAPAFCQEYR